MRKLCRRTYSRALRRCARKAEHVIGQLTNVAESLKDILATLQKRQIKAARTLKVVVHKNEAKAYERLIKTLRRMNQDTRDFENKMMKIGPRTAAGRGKAAE